MDGGGFLGWGGGLGFGGFRLRARVRVRGFGFVGWAEFITVIRFRYEGEWGGLRWRGRCGGLRLFILGVLIFDGVGS